MNIKKFLYIKWLDAIVFFLRQKIVLVKLLLNNDSQEMM